MLPKENKLSGISVKYQCRIILILKINKNYMNRINMINKHLCKKRRIIFLE